jgi:tripartite-type tricarboxylate transporter receptor subunit TctC
MKRVLRVLVAGVCFSLLQGPFAQTYPVKPIHLTVTNPPGPSTDLFARMVAPKIGEALGQPVVVENSGGASGMIGAEHVAHAAPDGYNIMFCTTTQLMSVVVLNKTIPYDPMKDFAPITLAIQPVEIVLMRPNAPFKSFREFIDYARRNPGKLTYGSAGIGSTFHMVGETLKSAAGVDILHVPFKSPVLATQDVVADRVDIAFSAFGSTRTLITSGKVKLVAILENERFKGSPDVPTVAEIVPGFEKVPSWFAFLGPAGLPPAIVSRWNAEVAKAMNAPDVRAWLDTNGLLVVASTPEQLTARIKSGTEVYRKVVNQLGIKPE